MKIAAIHIIYYYILVALHMLYLVLTITIKAIFCHHNFFADEALKANWLILGPYSIKLDGLNKGLVPTPVNPQSCHPIFTDQYLAQRKVLHKCDFSNYHKDSINIIVTVELKRLL